MKKLLIVLLCVLLMLPTALLTACGENKDVDHLVIYNWADYIYDYEEDFKAYYKSLTGRDIELTYVTFDTNETMMTKIVNNDAQVDIMCPSEYAIQKLVEGNYLMKIDYFTDSAFVNSGNVDRDLLAVISKSFEDKSYTLTDYMVPYMWGTLGILYNADKVDSDAAYRAGWGLLWNVDENGNTFDENLNGKIYMKDSIRDSYCAVVMYMKQYDMLPVGYENLTVGQLINSVDDTMLAKSLEALTAQKPMLYGYEVDFGKNDLVAGTALVDLAWSGDAMYAIETAADEDNTTLDYFVPQTGGNIWLDGWVIPKTCANLEQAKIFIDWLNDPVVAMNNMMEIGYTSAVDADVIRASDEAIDVYMEVYEYEASQREEALSYFFDDIRRYPDATASNLGVMQDFGKNNDKVVTMWEKVRSQGVTTLPIILIVVAAVIVVAVVLFVIIKFGGKKKRRQVVAK